MSASAWFESRFTCSVIALFVTPSSYWEIKFLTQCRYSGPNWPKNKELLKKNSSWFAGYQTAIRLIFVDYLF